jgi:CRP-like cAMP-binding protein
MTVSIVEILARTELFMGLVDEDLLKIAGLPSCRIQTFESGASIFQPEDSAGDLYVLVEGDIKVCSNPADAPEGTCLVEVGRITKGGTFGLSALVPPRIRKLTAIAEARSRVISIGARDLQALFEAEHRIGYEVMLSLVRVIGSKLRNVERLLVREQHQF